MEATSLGFYPKKLNWLEIRSQETPLQRILWKKDVGIIPLSFAQQRIYFLNQLMPGSSLYCLSTAVRFTGPINISVLERSLNEIIRRHEILRTTFPNVDGRPFQVIAPSLYLSMEKVDIHEMCACYGEESFVIKLLNEEAGYSFDLSKGPLIRAKLYYLNEDKHILIISIHNIVSDEFSIGIFLNELGVLYQAFSSGKPSPLSELPVQYKDFTLWQSDWFQGEKLKKLLSYWKEQISDTSPNLQLPTAHPRQTFRTFQPARASLTLSHSLIDALETLSFTKNSPIFVKLLAGLHILLHRYSGQDNIVVYMPVANRGPAQIEGLIGLFANTLMLKTRLTDHICFHDFLEHTDQALARACEHALPFEKLLDEIRPEQDESHNPLFPVIVSPWLFADVTLELSGLTMTPLYIPGLRARADLLFEFEEKKEQGLTVWCEYNPNLFDPATITRMLNHFETLLKGVTANPDQYLTTLPLLTDAEKHKILVEWNGTKKEYQDSQLIHHMLQTQAQRAPDDIAVVFEGNKLTYKELNHRANQLAHYLGHIGVGPEVIVGICVERSIDMIVGILGILKAGGAYLPLDPAYPKERLAFMLDEVRVPVLLTQQRAAARLPQHQARIVYLDKDWPMISTENTENPTSLVTQDNLAYIIYTSGSTGKPKGVMVQHRGLCNLAETQVQTFHTTSSNRVIQFFSLSFDGSIFEIVMALRAGGTLYLGTPEFLQPGPPLAKTLRENFITNITISPSALAALSNENLPDLKTIVTAGEACPAELVSIWGQGRRFFNAYGPTEVTVWNTVSECKDGSETPAIGRPIANTQVYLLDQSLQPVPVGVPGEIYIGGVGLARGYLDHPELTAENFIPNPFSEEPGSRLYKTADLGRYRLDGNIEFLGRVDHQVKIRGFRIELGEIEAVLGQHSNVQKVVVLAREDRPGEKRLVAYVVPRKKGEFSVNQLRSFLQEKLPEYMVPSFFIELESMPLSESGKVNRLALPMPSPQRPNLEQAYAPPQSDLEQKIAGVWEEVLNIKKVGVNDNFFDLGGTSIDLVQAHSKLQNLLNREISIIELFFKYPTVNASAKYLSGRESGQPTGLKEHKRGEMYREAVKQQTERRKSRRTQRKAGDEE